MAIPSDVLVNKSRMGEAPYQTPMSVEHEVDQIPIPSFSSENPDTSYAVGTKVLHPKFGAGIIIKRKGSEDDLKVDIFFKKPYGKKHIAINNVKLLVI